MYWCIGRNLIVILLVCLWSKRIVHGLYNPLVAVEYCLLKRGRWSFISWCGSVENTNHKVMVENTLYEYYFSTTLISHLSLSIIRDYLHNVYLYFSLWWQHTYFIPGTDNGKDLFISTPNLKSSERVLSTGMLGIKKSVTGNLNPAPASARSHKRSTSVSISSVTKRASAANPTGAGSSPGLWA